MWKQRSGCEATPSNLIKVFECARRLDLVMEVENITDEISILEVDESNPEPSHHSASPPLTNHDLPEFPVPTRTLVFTKHNSCQLPPCTKIGYLPAFSDVSCQLENAEGMENNCY